MACSQVGFQLFYVVDLHPNALFRLTAPWELCAILPRSNLFRQQTSLEISVSYGKENSASYHCPFQSLNIWTQDCNILH